VQPMEDGKIRLTTTVSLDKELLEKELAGTVRSGHVKHLQHAVLRAETVIQLRERVNVYEHDPVETNLLKGISYPLANRPPPHGCF
jgi:hypothetical protein